ncbi:MAG: type II toxin-antitoxin system VapC family toxin [Bacteroidota bacterium]
MKPRLYIETSLISYLAAPISGGLITAARQTVTHNWWRTQRQHYELFISDAVLDEAARGNATKAQQRLDLVRGIAKIAPSTEQEQLVQLLLPPGYLPAKASVDAAHIAAATLGGADFLLTWNFKHLANAVLRKRVEQLCRNEGYDPPLICTPEELEER